MRYFVTGAAGFIGSHYVRALLAGQLGNDYVDGVTSYDVLTYAGDRQRLEDAEGDPRHTFVRGNIAYWGQLKNVLPGHDVVVNFAAESHVDRSIVRSQNTFITNTMGVENLLRTSVECGVSTFVQVSTDEVYGSSTGEEWTEDSPMLPNSPYSASKAAAEHACRAWVNTYDLDVRVTRGANTYGGWQHPEKLIPKAVTSVLTGQKIPVYGDGSNVRDWLHVSDHCRAIQTVVDRGRPGETYNVAGSAELTNLQLLERLLSHVVDDPMRHVQFVEDRPGHDLRYSMSDEKLRQLDWRPRVTIDEGLEATAAWYRENRDWWSRHLPSSSRPRR